MSEQSNKTPCRKIVVLISGTGRNLQALIGHCQAGHLNAEIALVISNNPTAYGLQRAAAHGISTKVIDHRQFADRSSFEQSLIAAIDAAGADLLVLAGFMRILTPAFTQHYRARAINIHPSLLPKHPGLNTHAAALAAGDAVHGASVHFVTADLDGGPVLIQGQFTVPAHISAADLGQAVMQNVELKILPQAVAWVLDQHVQLRDTTVFFRGQALCAPLTLADIEVPFL